MRERDELTYTCMFGGGAIRGAAHAGAIKYFEEIGLKPEIIAGSSVGAMVAMLYAVGYNSQEISEAFLSVNFELFRDISFGFNQQFALSKGNVFLNWLRELIEKKFYGENYISGQNPPVKFSDIQQKLVIITTDLKTFRCKEFSTFETPDYEIAMAVRISCCMPGLMRAVNTDDKLLVDGDLMKGKPMWMLSDNLKHSKNRLLEIRLEGCFQGSDEHPAQYVNGMYSCMTSTETDFITQLYGKSDKYDYLVINTGNVVVVDFNYPTEKKQEIIEQGYEQTKVYFTDYLVKKKRKLLEIYTNLLEQIKKISFFMTQKKYIPAKNLTSEIFVWLIEVKDIINSDVYNSLKIFQNLLFNNVKTGLLGRSRCDNAEIINKVLIEFIKDLEEKKEGLEYYIDKF